MNAASLSTNPFSHVTKIGHAPEKPGVHVKELSEGDRHHLQMHFLALDASARLLRFGMVFPDELITTYVQQMNFARASMFGVYDSALMLVGVGHLAFTPRAALPVVRHQQRAGRGVRCIGIRIGARHGHRHPAFRTCCYTLP